MTNKGWRSESERHQLASKGVKTKKMPYYKNVVLSEREKHLTEKQAWAEYLKIQIPAYEKYINCENPESSKYMNIVQPAYNKFRTIRRENKKSKNIKRRQ
jgi:hypothetical protein